MLHLATAADTGQFVASLLTDKDSRGGSQVGHLLDQVGGPVAAVIGVGAYHRDDVYAAIAARYPDAAVVVPPRECGAERRGRNRADAAGCTLAIYR